jgi:hypothetical protein
MYRESRERGVDSDLAARVGGLSRASQRWLKMALVAIGDLDVEREEAPPARQDEAPQAPSPRHRPTANLEDVIRGKSTLDEQLEEYPELSDEMEGLADVIDLLREAGEARRRRGDQILREEILGEGSKEEEGKEQEGE